jgi:hypothetical protein
MTKGIIANGRYNVKHRTLETEYILKAYNGTFKLMDKNTEVYIRTITHFYLHEFYTISDKLPAEKKFYDIHWMVAGKAKEIIQMNAPYAVCKSKVQHLSHSTHRFGKLLIVPKT